MTVVLLTEKAIKELKRVAGDEKLDLSKSHVRVGVQGGGCSGFQYALKFDDAFDPAKDEAMEQDGISVIVDKKSALFIEGTELDFHDGLEKRGFVFSNPNAVKTCGCGSSFNA